MKFGIKQSVNLDEVYEELLVAFKKKSVDYCPNCDNPTEIYSNPFYFHECETCEWTGPYTQCKTKTNKDFVKEVLKKYYD